MPETVSIVDRYGLQRDVPIEVAQEELELGAQLESPEAAQARLEAAEYGGLDDAALALGEGALSGATLGGYDLLASEIGGDEYRAGRAARDRYNPLASTAGEVGGAIAPLLLSGGTSAAARGVSLIGAPTRGVAALGGLAERAVARGLGAAGVEGAGIVSRGLATGAKLAAGGAVEGGLFGAGQALSEAALAPGGDYDKLGEKLWAGLKQGAGYGALAGGGLGFLGGATSRAVERGMEALTGAEGLRNLLSRAAEGGVLKALGTGAGDARKLLKKRGDNGVGQMAQDLLTHRLDDGTHVFKAGDDAEAIATRVNAATEEVGAKLGAVRKQVDDFIETNARADLRPDMKRFFGKVDEAVAGSESMPPMLAGRVKSAAEQFAPLRSKWESGLPVSFKEAQAYRQQIDKILTPDKPMGGITVAAENAAQLQALRRELKATLDDSLEKATGEMGGAASLTNYRELNRRYGSLADAQGILQREAGQNLARNRVSLTESLAGAGGLIGAAATGSFVPAVAGVALGSARKLYRDRGESVMAVLADRLSKVDKRLDDGVRKFFKRSRDSTRGLLGAGAAEDVETRTRTDRALGRRSKETPGDAYRRRLQEAASLQQDPHGVLERQMGTKIPTAAPRAAMAMTSAAIRGAQFLSAKAPVGMLDQDALLPQMQPQDPDPVELSRFSRYVQVVDDPYSVLDELGDGTLTSQHVEALREVYPKIFEDVQGKVWGELLEQKELPSYESRILLGTLFDIPADKSLRPASIAAAAAMYAQRTERAESPQSPSGGSLGIAKALATKVQDLEGSEMET